MTDNPCIMGLDVIERQRWGIPPPTGGRVLWDSEGSENSTETQRGKIDVDGPMERGIPKVPDPPKIRNFADSTKTYGNPEGNGDQRSGFLI